MSDKYMRVCKHNLLNVCSTIIVICFLGFGSQGSAGNDKGLPYKLKDCIMDTTGKNFGHEGISLAANHSQWSDFDVRNFGARGDGKTLDTKAIQQAIDAAARIGGRVVLSNGIFISGSMFLKPGVGLHIEKGATLKGTQDETQYPTIKTRVAGIEMPWPAGLINADNMHGVRITGLGTIDGSGQPWWDKFWSTREKNKGPIPADWMVGRPRPIVVSRSKDVYIEGLTIIDSPFWTVHVIYSEEIEINGLIIRSPKGAASSDGIDIDSCRNVLIRDCDISCDDDCIVLKSGRDADGLRVNLPTENVVVRDCITRMGHGMVGCGTEISGGVRNVLVKNCKAIGTTRGIRLKSRIGRGGSIENILYEDIVMEDVRTVIRFRITDRDAADKGWMFLEEPVEPLSGETALPKIRNIVIRNVKANGALWCIHCLGDARTPFSNVIFENVELSGSNGMNVEHAVGWDMRGVKAKAAEGKLLVLKNVKNSIFPSQAEADAKPAASGKQN
jgi:polygalacturonase